MTIIITTSDVNGIRTARHKGIEDWAGKYTPDAWYIQKVRASQNNVDSIFDEFSFEYATTDKTEAPANLHAMDEVCRVKGRAGVGLLTGLEVLAKRYGLPGLNEDVDSECWIETDAKTPEGYMIAVTSMYVHAGNTDNPTKMEQKYRFLDTILRCMGALRDRAAHGSKQTVLCDDFSIARTPLDIKDAEASEEHAEFLPEERAYVDKWLDKYEFVDMMRSLADDIQGLYTWRNRRGCAFDNNVGWRINYQFAAPELAETARGFVVDEIPTYNERWSDRTPLTITYEV